MMKTYTYDRSKLDAQILALSLAIKGMVGKGVYQGLVRLGADIWHDAAPMAPRDTNNLRGSAFEVGSKAPGRATVHHTPKPKRPTPEPENIALGVTEARAFVASKVGPVVLVGFAASYAEIVHEGDPNKNWHNGGPQFLTKSVANNVPRAPRVIETEMAKFLVN